jgi:glutathione S-transferase
MNPAAQQLPVLYSFRRCPYAIRARLALASAGLIPGRDLELREVALRAKPPELLAASANGTVPVLVLRQGAVLQDSLTIMQWALQQGDPQGWLSGWSAAEQRAMGALIAENDGAFKTHLDRFKYPDRYPGERSESHRLAAVAILMRWSERLANGGWMLGAQASIADWALLPFVRQFRLADPDGFDAAHGLAPLQAWLGRCLSSPELAAVMEAPWAERRPWRSPGWLYHLALRPEWHAARGDRFYCRSTRGQSLDAVGFIHLSKADQVETTAQRFYSDVPSSELLLLTIDPQRLAGAGLEVREEPAPDTGERFPHLYGALPLEAVLLAEPLRR